MRNLRSANVLGAQILVPPGLQTQPVANGGNGGGGVTPAGGNGGMINIGRPQVATAADAIFAFNERPLLNIGDQRVLRGPFQVAVTITDNAAVAQSLVIGSLWDVMVQGLYSSSASPLEAVLHLNALEVYVNSATFLTESATTKALLDNRLYIRTKRDGVTVDFPMRGRIRESLGMITRFDHDGDATSTLLKGLGAPYVLPRPIRLDLKSDTLEARVDTGIDLAGDTVVYLMVHGVLLPRETPGALVKDTQCAPTGYAQDVGGAPTAIGPIGFAGINADYLIRTPYGA